MENDFSFDHINEWKGRREAERRMWVGLLLSANLVIWSFVVLIILGL